MVLFVWLVVMREQWRSVIVESGALSAMIAGTVMMQQWSANSWDSREQVRSALETMTAVHIGDDLQNII